MKKRFISAVCALAVTAAGVGAPVASAGIIPAAITASADEELTYGDFKYKVITIPDRTTNAEYEAIEITKYDGFGGNVVIPDTIDGKDVVQIGEKAFYYDQFTTSVKMGKNIKYIQYNAFYHCDNLRTVDFNDGLRAIYGMAFAYTPKLVTVHLPNSVVGIDEKAFFSCGVKDLVLPNGGSGSSLDIITNAFASCNNLTSVTIPGTLQYMGWYAFADCTNLTTVKVEEGADEIGAFTFQGCTSLENVSLPSTLIYLSGNFIGCTKLTELSVPQNVDEIGGETFSGCTSLKTVYLPKKLEKISDDAFKDCGNLKDVYYEGAAEDWKKIEIRDGNDQLQKVTFHYGYEYPVPGSDPQPVDPKPAPTKQSIAKATVKAANKIYTGKALTPNVKVTLNGKALKNGTDYTVAYKNNKNCGKGAATVTGKGNYTGTKSASFIIKPAKIKVKKVTSPKKSQIKVTWKKAGGKVTGYQVQIGLNKKFTKGKKTYVVKKPAASAKTIKKLRAGKKYFARVRAFKTIDKKNYFGKWSAVKAVKCKK